MKLSSITFPRIVSAIRMTVLIPGALLARIWKPNVWIISERPDQARDNGYCFFKYMKEHHPEQPIYYLIDKNAADKKKIDALGSIIHFNSRKHYFYYILATVHISAHVGGCIPKNNPFARYIRKQLGIFNVFLPHGVSYGISDFCLAKYGNIDLFVTSGRPEYENVLENYGYRPDQVVYTGFPRLDGWHHIKIDPKQIVLMPTWRLYLAQDPGTVFEETAYYHAYFELINNKELEDFLVNHELKLIFYLHHNMRKYVNSFHTDCRNIEVVYDDAAYDIQELLKESALLITDYSSVHFDFAYMNKPVLYYRFDWEEFRARQYQQSNFDAEKDGFGPVAADQEQLLVNLKDAYVNGFKLQGVYKQRMEKFYELRDENNCERVYHEIVARMTIRYHK